MQTYMHLLRSFLWSPEIVINEYICSIFYYITHGAHALAPVQTDSAPLNYRLLLQRIIMTSSLPLLKRFIQHPLKKVDLVSTVEATSTSGRVALCERAGCWRIRSRGDSWVRRPSRMAALCWHSLFLPRLVKYRAVEFTMQQGHRVNVPVSWWSINIAYLFICRIRFPLLVKIVERLMNHKNRGYHLIINPWLSIQPS